MIIRAAKDKDNPYVQINKTIFTDHEISVKAKGVFASIMCLPDDWVLQIEHLTKLPKPDEKRVTFKEHKDTIYSAVNELLSKNYIARVEFRDEKNQKEKSAYIVFETPKNIMETTESELILIVLDLMKSLVISKMGQLLRPNGKYTVYLESKNETGETIRRKIDTPLTPLSQNLNPENLYPENPDIGNPDIPFPTQLINNSINKQKKEKEREATPAAAQNGKPATQPTDENISLSPEKFLKDFLNRWELSDGTHSEPLTDRRFIELAKTLHPKRPDGGTVKSKTELERIDKQIPPADRIWLLIRIVKYSRDESILDDSGKTTFAKYLDKYIEDFSPLIAQEKEHYRGNLQEKRQQIEREKAEREAQAATERELQEEKQLISEFENRLETMTDEEKQEITKKTLEHFRKTGEFFYKRYKNKPNLFDENYTKYQGAKIYFDLI